MYKSRLRERKAKPAAPAEPVATVSSAKVKPKQKPKTVRFTATQKPKREKNKKDRISRRDAPRGNRRSLSSPSRDGNFPYASYGYPGFGFPPYGYYPQFNPVGYGMVPQYAMGAMGAMNAPRLKLEPERSDLESASNDDESNDDEDWPAPAPAKRMYRSKSVSDPAPTVKSRGRPKSNVAWNVKGTANHTVVSGALKAANTNKAPAKRTLNRSQSVASRVQTIDSALDLPWLETSPRFGVIENSQRRPVPNLTPLRSSAGDKSPMANVSRDKLDSITPENEMLQVQLKVNAELLSRIEALEKENKASHDEIKAIQAIADQKKKENAVLKIKLDQSSAENAKWKQKLAKSKPADTANKENMEMPFA